MKKQHVTKICLLMVLILSMIMSVSFAEEEITVSGRVNAELYADQALEQNYGITLLLREYFIRTVEEKDDNVFIVRSDCRQSPRQRSRILSYKSAEKSIKST